MKKPAVSVAIAEESETGKTLQGVVDATLRVAEARAEKRRRMREAILARNTASVLALACELAGFSGREVAKHVEEMLTGCKLDTPISNAGKLGKVG